MEKRKSYVYKIRCLVTDEYYFGSSFNAKSNWYWGGGKRIRERIAQYGKENFVKEILGEFDDRVEAHKVENEYIEKFRNDDKCLNERIEYHFGSFSYETCAKIGVAHTGKHLSKETRSRMSAAKRGEKSNFFGKHHTEEAKAKMSASHIGKHRTEETKQKIRESRIGRTPWNKGKKLNKETGKYE